MSGFSVGTDLIEIERIRKSCERQNFVDTVFSAAEQKLFADKKDPAPSMAANWAAKEAFAKALGTGVRGFRLNEVSVLRDGLGCPYLELEGSARDISEERGLDFSVSLTHTKDYASATVIAFKKED
ncbi:MAG: holo-ACP synthase [Ruminococcus sp.]|nr:holo-ACP synthase [Ruminococcus sp.]